MGTIFKIQENLTANQSSKVAYRKEYSLSQHFLYQCRHVGYEYNEKGYYIDRQNGVTYLLAFTKSGSATLQYEGETITLNPGSLIFLSLANHNIISAPENPWEIYFIHLFGPEIDTIYNSVYQNQGYYFSNFNADKFIESIMAIYEAYQSEEVNYYHVSSLVYQILMDVLMQIKPSKYDYVIMKAIDYMEEHHAEPFDLNKLCQFLFLSKSHFIHKFHAQTGMSPKRYLTEIRVQKAKRYLGQTKKSIAEIAQLTGFENEKNIYYAFKTIVGYSPTDFRSNLY